MNMDDKQKQIEKMAEIIEKRRLEARVTVGSLNEGVGMWYAKDLYKEGYRKRDEVIKDVFEGLIAETKAVQEAGYDGLGVKSLKNIAKLWYGVEVEE